MASRQKLEKRKRNADAVLEAKARAKPSRYPMAPDTYRGLRAMADLPSHGGSRIGCFDSACKDRRHEIHSAAELEAILERLHATRGRR